MEIKNFTSSVDAQRLNENISVVSVIKKMPDMDPVQVAMPVQNDAGKGVVKLETIRGLLVDIEEHLKTVIAGRLPRN